MSRLRNLKHRDRVKCPNNPKIKDKVFTVQEIPEAHYLKLYQTDDMLLFSRQGICVQAPLQGFFEVGDTLELYKKDTDY